MEIIILPRTPIILLLALHFLVIVFWLIMEPKKKKNISPFELIYRILICNLFFSQVTDHLHEKFPSYSNGKLTIYRSMLVCSQQLSGFALQWGLDKIVNVDLTHVKKNHRILGEALEAYIGAYYLDCCQIYGMSDAHMKVKELCINLIDPMLDLIIKTWKVWITLFQG